jgi:TRAP-type mannitol/chloroaromatic compound transport system substrate-binding protein
MDIRMGFHKVAPYYYAGWHEPASDMQFLINKKEFDKLPKSYQVVLKAAMQAVSADMYAENFADSALAWAQMKEEYPNIKVKTFPKEVLAKMKEETDNVLNAYAEKDAFFKEVLTSQREFMAKAREWTTISEFYYLETSAAVRE